MAETMLNKISDTDTQASPAVHENIETATTQILPKIDEEMVYDELQQSDSDHDESLQSDSDYDETWSDGPKDDEMVSSDPDEDESQKYAAALHESQQNDLDEDAPKQDQPKEYDKNHFELQHENEGDAIQNKSKLPDITPAQADQQNNDDIDESKHQRPPKNHTIQNSSNIDSPPMQIIDKTNDPEKDKSSPVPQATDSQPESQQDDLRKNHPNEDQENGDEMKNREIQDIKKACEHFIADVRKYETDDKNFISSGQDLVWIINVFIKTYSSQAEARTIYLNSDIAEMISELQSKSNKISEKTNVQDLQDIRSYTSSIMGVCLNKLMLDKLLKSISETQQACKTFSFHDPEEKVLKKLDPAIEIVRHMATQNFKAAWYQNTSKVPPPEDPMDKHALLGRIMDLNTQKMKSDDFGLDDTNLLNFQKTVKLFLSACKRERSHSMKILQSILPKLHCRRLSSFVHVIPQRTYRFIPKAMMLSVLIYIALAAGMLTFTSPRKSKVVQTEKKAKIFF
eukprot:95466-Hanusia_phi.AAC.6